jgi:hypothetical protein
VYSPELLKARIVGLEETAVTIPNKYICYMTPERSNGAEKLCGDGHC